MDRINLNFTHLKSRMYLSSYSGVCSMELQLCLWGPTLEILKPGQPWRKPASVKPACQPARVVLSSGKVGSTGLMIGKASSELRNMHHLF